MKFYLITFLINDLLYTKNIVAPDPKTALMYLNEFKDAVFLSLILKLE
jgi:hypothetical protein